MKKIAIVVSALMMFVFIGCTKDPHVEIAHKFKSKIMTYKIGHYATNGEFIPFTEISIEQVQELSDYQKELDKESKTLEANGIPNTMEGIEASLENLEVLLKLRERSEIDTASKILDEIIENRNNTKE